MRSTLPALILFISTTAASAAFAQHAAIYVSVEDPPGQQVRKVLGDQNGLRFGQTGDDGRSLVRSDLGLPLYFVRVEGGVRVRGQPIVFPTDSQTHLDFEDYSCSTLGSRTNVSILCRSKNDGQLYRSQVAGGALVSFEINCFDEIDQVCHYELAAGEPIRPTKIQNE